MAFLGGAFAASAGAGVAALAGSAAFGASVGLGASATGGGASAAFGASACVTQLRNCMNFPCSIASGDSSVYTR